MSAVHVSCTCVYTGLVSEPWSECSVECVLMLTKRTKEKRKEVRYDMNLQNGSTLIHMAGINKQESSCVNQNQLRLSFLLNVHR